MTPLNKLIGFHVLHLQLPPTIIRIRVMLDFSVSSCRWQYETFPKEIK